MYNSISSFFLFEQKESKIQERSYRPLQGRTLLRRLSDHAPRLVKFFSLDYLKQLLYAGTKFKNISLFFTAFILYFSPYASAQNKFTKADSLRGMLTSLRTCYDVLTYDLDITVNPNEKTISGSNSITLEAQTDFKKLQLDLFKNLQIQKVVYNNNELSYQREFDAVFVNFIDTIKKGDSLTLKVYYSGKPILAKRAPWDGGFIWQNDSAGSDWVGVSCQHLGASSWWPCKDHQSDEPQQMYIRVTVPIPLMAICNGKLINKITLPDNRTKYEWHVSYPINNYAVTLNIAAYKHLQDNYINSFSNDTLTLDYYVLPNKVEKALKHFEQVKSMMDCYYKLFGSYPFVNDGYKLVETPYLGMEHQSCIAYGNNYKNGYLGRDLSGSGYGNKFDYIIIHETAHEWWGNAVTTNDIADMWVHEGFGTYTEALYVECFYGYEAYLKYINGFKRAVKNDKPIVASYGVNEMGSSDMYPKGALMLHTIRGIINNDSLFFSIVKGIQDTYKYKTIDSKGVEHYISEKSQMDLSSVFNAYLRNSKIPVFEYSLTKKRKSIIVNYKYSQPDELFMPIKITTQIESYSFIYPTNSWQTITLKGMKKKYFKVATDLFYMDITSN